VKLLTINELALRLSDYKSKGKKIVLCHGCFDLMHPGHIKYFQAAKKMGDLLVVTVTPDKYVDKGPDRPVFSDRLRSGFTILMATTFNPACSKRLRTLPVRPRLTASGLTMINDRS